MPPDPLFLRQSAPYGACRDLLTVFGIAQKNLPDLEERSIAKPAIAVALGRRDQARQKARAHIGMFWSDRIGESKRLCAAAKRKRPLTRNKRPCHRFNEAIGGECAFGGENSLLQQSQNGAARTLPKLARKCFRRNPIDPRYSQYLLDKVGFVFDVGPESGHCYYGLATITGRIGECEPEVHEDTFHFRNAERKTCQAAHFGPRKSDAFLR